MTAATATIVDDLTRRGHTITDAGRYANGYYVRTDDRASAYSIGRTVLNEFDGDPDAGDVTVAVRTSDAGDYTVEVLFAR